MVMAEIQPARGKYLESVDTELTQLIGVDHLQITPVVILQKGKKEKFWRLYPTVNASDGSIIQVLGDNTGEITFNHERGSDELWMLINSRAKGLIFEAIKVGDSRHFDNLLFSPFGKFNAQARIYNFGTITNRFSKANFKLWALDFAGEQPPAERYQVRAAEWMIKQLTRNKRNIELGVGIKVKDS